MSPRRHHASCPNKIYVPVREGSSNIDGESWVKVYSARYALRGFTATGIITETFLDATLPSLSEAALSEIGGIVGDSRTPYGRMDFDDVSPEIFRSFNDMKKADKRKFAKSFSAALSEAVRVGLKDLRDNEFERKLLGVQELLRLSSEELELVRLIISTDKNSHLENYLESELSVFWIPSRELFAKILGTDLKTLEEALRGKLSKLEFLQVYTNRTPTLSDDFFECMESPLEKERFSRFVPARKPELCVEDFFLDRDEIELLIGLLSSTGETPVHVLFQGPPGSGKTQFARALASRLPVQAYEVNPSERKSSHWANLLTAHAFSLRGGGELIIADDAEKLLGGDVDFGFLSMFLGKESGDKSAVNYLMDRPYGKCLWIVNSDDGIPESVKRRFNYTVFFPNLGKKERRRIWVSGRETLKDIGGDLLKDDSIDSLSENYDLSPGIIVQSFRKGLEAGADTPEKLRFWIQKQLDSHLELLGKNHGSPRVPEEFRVEALETSFDPKELLSRLSKWHENNLLLSSERRRGMRLLFHGIPGTGKTELAHYLAKELGAEIIRFRASEVLSAYFGESEQRVNQKFRDAQAAKGVILVDEVDSFLSVRDATRNKPYMAVTNEFLTCMERFQWLLIGTTNVKDNLDPAALRRFPIKVEFRAMGKEGILKLFEVILAPISGKPLNQAETSYLLSLPSLVPSDFTNTADLVRWGAANPDNLSILEILAEEARSRVGAKEQSPETETESPADEGAGDKRSVN
jgi:DNA polymerase III delta prime subunit